MHAPQVPTLESAASTEDWIREFADATGVNEAVVREIVSQVETRASKPPETPWDSESSGRTYTWPVDEHGDF